MSETTQSLSDLGAIVAGTDAPEAVAAAPAAPMAPVSVMPLRERIVDALGRSYATGRRKDAVARVWVKPGTGKITVNGRDQEVYFARPTLRLVINQVFGVADRIGAYDVIATVKGGGLSGQAGAVKHGISQAITKQEPTLRGVVKAALWNARNTARQRRARASNSRSVNPNRHLQIYKRPRGNSGPFLFVMHYNQMLLVPSINTATPSSLPPLPARDMQLLQIRRAAVACRGGR
jgi:small subunit ribosomal protein S9